MTREDILERVRRVHDPLCDACRFDNYKYVLSCGLLQEILFDRSRWEK